MSLAGGFGQKNAPLHSWAEPAYWPAGRDHAIGKVAVIAKQHGIFLDHLQHDSNK